MINLNRIAFRTDFNGPPSGNRPLLRLSRFGGGGVFYIPASQPGYATTASKSMPQPRVLNNVQGAFERTAAVIRPTNVGPRGGKQIGFRGNAYRAPAQIADNLSRANFKMSRATCPHCGGKL